MPRINGDEEETRRKGVRCEASENLFLLDKLSKADRSPNAGGAMRAWVPEIISLLSKYRGGASDHGSFDFSYCGWPTPLLDLSVFVTHRHPSPFLFFLQQYSPMISIYILITLNSLLVLPLQSTSTHPKILSPSSPYKTKTQKSVLVIQRSLPAQP